jgi:hypothetical protein
MIGLFKHVTNPDQDDIADHQKYVAKKNMWEQVLVAAKATEILSPERKLSELSKGATVHLPCHGTVNTPYLTTLISNGDVRQLSTVAADLKKAGLQDGSRVKMRSCHSADALQQPAFVKDPPGTVGSKEAPAQTLANALDDAGVNGVTVVGYQGSGKRFGRAEGHSQQIDATNAHVPSSTVRKDFTSNRSFVDSAFKFFGF